MNAVAKKEIEAHVVDRLGHVFDRHEKQPVEILTSGISEIDQALAGFPRGSISEIHGTASCGRTSLMLATLAKATSSEETCALIDCSDTFDLSSARDAGVNFDRLLWVRCKSNIEHAFKAVDLLLHGGGFGLVVLNLADMPAGTLRRIVSTWWFRFRRAIENTPAVLLVAAPVACGRSCAAMTLELKTQSVWMTPEYSADGEKKADLITKNHLSLVPPEPRETMVTHSRLLQGLSTQVYRQRPVTAIYHPISFTSQNLRLA